MILLIGNEIKIFIEIRKNMVLFINLSPSSIKILLLISINEIVKCSKLTIYKSKIGMLRNLGQSKIYGNINELNYYYINLFLGKEKIKQSFLLDTGSEFTSIPCKPYCYHCGQHIIHIWKLMKINY